MTRVAILIDGGYYLKRLPAVRRDVKMNDPESVAESVRQLVRGHLEQLNHIHEYRLDRLHEQLYRMGKQLNMIYNQQLGKWSSSSPASLPADYKDTPSPFRLLYRCFYYDAPPYEGKLRTPISERVIDYSKTDVAIFRSDLFAMLRKQPNLALRLGEVRVDGSRSWILKARSQNDLLGRRRPVDDLTDDDFVPSLRQKGVDMRIGIDIASITLKKQADTIVLVSGDSDFVPAAKFARREGVRFILDPLWRSVSPNLSEHIDGLTSGFPRPNDGKNSPLTGA